MTDLFLYDDATARTFEPFSLTRPTAELRAGALLLRERWERALGGANGARAAGTIASAHLADFDEPWAAPIAQGKLSKGSIVAHSRCAVSVARLPDVDTVDVWRCNGQVAAARLARDVEVKELASGTVALESFAKTAGRSADVFGRWIENVWDFIGHLAPMLTEDIQVLAVGAKSFTGGAGSMVRGEHRVYIEDGTNIEPQVLFDTSTGPILVRRGGTVQAFTRVVGPCVVGVESSIGGDKISGVSVGDVCKVHGEVSATIFLGHANKGHDGFLGHSYLGRWVNLGAGTITSNLKNTYGHVQLWTPAGVRDTGLQFVGTFFGDHAKTGIGTSLNTGTVIGAGANIYGSVMPPKVVPPFAWGDKPPYSTYRADKFLEVARRMMERRHVGLSTKQERQLIAAYEGRWSVGKE